VSVGRAQAGAVGVVTKASRSVVSVRAEASVGQVGVLLAMGAGCTETSADAGVVVSRSGVSGSGSGGVGLVEGRRAVSASMGASGVIYKVSVSEE
jgi:hypothetical protein